MSFTNLNFEHSHLKPTEAVPGTQNVRRLWIVIGLRSSLLLVELVVGFWTHSLSLLAVAGHMLSDVFTLGAALIAASLAQLPATGRATFGYRRLEILVALMNGSILIAIAALIAWRAIERFQAPEPVSALPTLIVAALGLAINILLVSLLHEDSDRDLNLRGAFLHVVADAVSFFGVILAAIVVYWFNWFLADAVASLFVACLICLSALPLVWDSLRILMEYAPPNIDVSAVEAVLSTNACVRQVDKLHIWTITSGQVVLCAHLAVESLNAQERDSLLLQLQAQLGQAFGIGESTLQIVALNESDRASYLC
ncbi:MAG: Cadmium, cobalt and zinc/H(+)-K(+) antiporter [Chroococcidiopsis cubana SAG 39.79]|nr:cation diffusion facilitator family transporter [Chroococcidiopsis cubana]MDZ4877869.1 Cadmium, cobalt and zinc/H(+)-K(+) antiporter [Chroococcidiopsis cubana SAG 39.79]